MALTKITSRILDSSGVTILGTISTGVWQGTAINQTYLVGQSGTNTGDETLARINALDITELGTVSSGVWNGTAIASAYLDADTAHLSTTQTFTGAKNFSSNATFAGDIALTGDSKIQATADLGIGARNGTTNAGAVYIGGANDNPFISPTAFFGTDGNVGIGTTSPSAKLQIHTATNAGNPEVAAFLVNESTTTNTEVRLAFAAHTNDIISTGRYSYISAKNTSGSNGQDLVFATNATGASATPKLTISSSGNVGINNGQSRGKITIGDNSSGAVTRGIVLENRVANAQGTGSSIEFYVNTGDNDRCAIIQSVQETAGNYANLEFFTANNGAPTKRLTISSGGNVGIATSGTIHNLFQVQVAADHRIGFWGSSSYSAIQSTNDANNTQKALRFDASSYTINGGNITISSGHSLFTQGTGRVYTHNVTLREQDNTAKFQIYSSGGGCVFYNNESNGAYYFYTNGAERLSISSGGDVGIGRGSLDNYRLIVRGESNADSSKYTFFAETSTGLGILGCRNDGQVFLPNAVSGTGYDLQSDGGQIVFVSSTRKVKKNIEPIDIGLDFILSLEPVKYDLKQNDLSQVGFIAEDIPDERLQVIQPNDNNDLSKGYSPQSVNYKQITAPLVKAIQEQQTIIEDLKLRIETLEG